MTDFSKQYTIEEELKRVVATRYEILETLVDVINQSCQREIKGDRFYIDHMCLSAYEGAFDLLERFGVIKKSTKGRFWIDWEKLKEMKP